MTTKSAFVPLNCRVQYISAGFSPGVPWAWYVYQLLPMPA